MTASPGEARFKIRHHALLMEEFTVSQIVSITGLRSDSVRTEVQRMKKQGYLTVSREAGAEAGHAGRPRCIYRLTSDTEKRLELARSVSAFYLTPDSQSAQSHRPQGRHYAEAISIIEHLEVTPPEDVVRRSEREEQASYHLDYAAHEEATWRLGKEVTVAYLDRARARLEILRGNAAQAEPLFERSLKAFQGAGLQEEADYTHDWLLAMRLKRQLAAAQQASPQEMAGVIEEAICDTIRPGSNPFLLLLRDICETLAAMAHFPLEEVHEWMKANLKAAASISESAEKIERSVQALAQFDESQETQIRVLLLKPPPEFERAATEWGLLLSRSDKFAFDMKPFVSPESPLRKLIGN